MNQPLSARTRVTVLYRDEEVQGVVLADSTEEMAHIEILGHAKRLKAFYPWGEVRKNEHRCFKVTETDDLVTITEIEPKNLHPMNWSGLGELSREGAWAFARARGKQTAFVGRDGSRTDLGRVFDPRAFERAAYSGYVGYGCSMTDGYYTPVAFEDWVKRLRTFPEQELASENDVASSVKAALPLYLRALTGISR